MNYEEVLKFMFSSLPMYQRIGSAAYKSNLDNSIALDTHFNYPHKSFKCIHIAGTNGKGSVSSSIASILQEAGYKVGLYTSPHILDYRERIRVNGKKISKEFVTEFINDNKSIISDLEPSFFEMSVALAFDYFRTERVDYAIIEVGMGGRLDSTNIISPIISVITNIGLDHTQFLGEKTEIIAVEKAGIIKENTPVVIGESNNKTKPVFEETAKEKKSPIFFADSDYSCKFISSDFKSGTFSIKDKKSGINKEYKFGLFGKYQEKNLATIFETIDQLRKLGIKISEDDLKNGLQNIKSNTDFLARWEVINTKPLTVCDIAHNTEGLKEVLEQLSKTEHLNIHFILGFVNDKNIAEILKLFPKESSYYFTEASIPRAMPREALFELAKNADLKGQVYETVGKAYETAISKLNEKDILYIGGSTFIVADLLSYIQASKD